MRRIVFFSMLLLVLAASAAYPTRMIIMPPGKEIPPDWPRRISPIDVKLLKVDVKIDNQVAVTKVDEVFHNPNICAVHCEYFFPLPEGAGVSDFRVRVGEKELKGEVLTKEEAQKLYMEMLRQHRNPALLEMAGRRVFRVRLGVVPANGEVRIRFQFVQALKAESGMVDYSFPLGIAREHPKPIGTLSFHAEIRSDTPIKNIVSPSHNVRIERNGDRAVTVVYEAENVPSERDMQLHYLLSKDDIGLSLLTYRTGTDDGYFMLLLSPKIKDGKVIPKDIVFVIDRSGSMSGRNKIQQARNALEFCLNSLNDGDRYDIISFSDNVTPFRGSLQDFTTDKEKAELHKTHAEALKYARNIQAAGGTDINSALLKALAEIKDSKRPAYIIFLTDGLPTVGETNSDNIVANVTTANAQKARLFAFGVGYNVNAIMLDRLAEENSGANEYVVENENIEVKVSALYAKVSSPMLSDIAVKAGVGAGLYDAYPRRLPDIFRGSQLILFGRYKGSGKVKVTLTGKVGDGEQKYEYEADFAKGETAHDFLPRLWAMRKISYLIMELRAKGENKKTEELQKEITALSQRYGVINEYTSYLIQSRGEAIPQNVRLQREAQVRVKGELDRAAQQARAPGGVGGVKFSQRNIAERKGCTQADFEAVQDEDFRRVQKTCMRNLRDRTFYLNDRDQYVQSDFKEKTETQKVEYLSDEYFALIEKHPDAAQYLSVGEQVVFNIGETWYEVYVKPEKPAAADKEAEGTQNDAGDDKPVTEEAGEKPSEK